MWALSGQPGGEGSGRTDLDSTPALSRAWASVGWLWYRQVERARCGDTPHSTPTPEPPATDQGPDLLARPRSRRCR